METYLASVDDASQLAVLHADSFGDRRWTLTQITDSLALTTTMAWAVREGNAFQGFILCQHVGDEFEVLTICVTPVARRKGIGEHLLVVALAAAKDKDVRHAFLEVAADNHAALLLYDKMCFRVTGKRRGYYRRGIEFVDAIMLELEL